MNKISIILLSIIFMFYLVYAIHMLSSFGHLNINFKPKKKRKSNKTKSNMSLSDYEYLINLYKQCLQYIAMIEEIDLLIVKKSNVLPTVLKDCKTDDTSNYLSSEYLIYWKKSLFNQLMLQFSLLKLMYLNINYVPDATIAKLYTSQIQAIADFIGKESNSL